MRNLGWRIVLLRPRSKKPTGKTWEVTTDPAVAEHHWREGGNLGLVCGPDSNVAVLDFDKIEVVADMCTQLGPLLPWVKTGSGKYHVYVGWEEGLPAKMMWNGEKVGEVQRGPMERTGYNLQHVVIPPSLHDKTGKPYIWLQAFHEDHRIISDSKLPDGWRRFLVEDSIPDFIPVGDLSGHPDAEEWEGPPVDEILRRAMMMPGARRRRNGIKFQCPGCAREGHDKSRDNAIVYDDGRWGCALDRDHKKDIGEAMGLGEEDAKLAEATVSDDVVGDIMKKLNG